MCTSDLSCAELVYFAVHFSPDIRFCNIFSVYCWLRVCFQFLLAPYLFSVAFLGYSISLVTSFAMLSLSVCVFAIEYQVAIDKQWHSFAHFFWHYESPCRHLKATCRASNLYQTLFLILNARLHWRTNVLKKRQIFVSIAFIKQKTFEVFALAPALSHSLKFEASLLGTFARVLQSHA